MDVIREEYIVYYRFESYVPAQIYVQQGINYNQNGKQGFCKRKFNNNQVVSFYPEYFTEILEKYTFQMKNRKLKTEVKICAEQGYKIIKKRGMDSVKICVSRFAINFTVWSDSGRRYDKGYGCTGNPDYIKNLEKEFEKLYMCAEAECLEKRIEKGFYEVILDPEATGVLVHEIVGHCMEYDIWKDNYKLQQVFKEGKQIAIPEVSICDNPLIEGAFGSYDYDDEGIAGRKVIMVSNGIVNEYMSSCSSNEVQSTNSNGHARAISYKHSPLVRMSNTYMEPGTISFDNMILSVKRGLYLCGAGESRGGLDFLASFPLCYWIENGKITDRVSSVRMIGNAEKVLSNISSVSNDFELYGGGDGGCGKWGQWPMAVSAGGPHIKIRNVFIM